MLPRIFTPHTRVDKDDLFITILIITLTERSQTSRL